MSSSSPLILVIDDEPQQRKLLRRTLMVGDFSYVGAETAAKGLSAIRTARPEAVLLGFRVPDAEALGHLRRVRGLFDGPIVVVSADQREAVKVVCLDAGATDYVTRPFHGGEMLARIRAMLRRYRQNRQMRTTVDVRGLHVDLISRVVSLDGQRLALTRTELKVLLLLSEQGGAAVPHADVVAHIWADDSKNGLQYLRVVVSNLRRKLAERGDAYDYITTTPKFGYRLNVRPGESSVHDNGFSRPSLRNDA